MGVCPWHSLIPPALDSNACPASLLPPPLSLSSLSMSVLIFILAASVLTPPVLCAVLPVTAAATLVLTGPVLMLTFKAAGLLIMTTLPFQVVTLTLIMATFVSWVINVAMMTITVPMLRVITLAGR